MMANDDATNDFIYDVFLSFRGEIRYSFIDHLYGALVNKGINTFRDDEKLRIGDEIRPSLLKAIEKSRLSMVVLSENYASSTWCVDELVKIMECYDSKGKHVWAIFYKVEPSDVRYQKNSYETAMTKHEKRFGQDSEKVKAWRLALFRVCELSGVHCRNDLYESEIIKKIVQDTCAKLPPMPLQIEHVVGLDSRLEEVKSLIDIESNDSICMLGIYGLGGIGKTLLAKNLYNKIRHHFEAASFLQNVREKSNKNSSNGLENLQMTLLSEMGEKVEAKIGSTFKGGCEIKRSLGHKRVLLVLDDVDSIKQLESLAGGSDWFGSGSKIIITTRDTTVLDKHVMGKAIIKKHKMKELNDHDSLKLFCWYAFNKSEPVENFEGVSSHAVSYANGFPLALKVIGCNLKGGSVEDWEVELDKYKKIPNVEIQGALEVSFNNLSELDQKMFLDIACFFRGERWEYVERILKACDFYPVIRVFVCKCLITIDENGCLEMHDLIQDMGREIVRKESPLNPGDRSRLWSHKEVLQVLKEDLGSNAVEGIILDPPRHEKLEQWTTTAFKKMKRLRILIVRNTLFSEGPSFLPNSLRLLDWKGYPSKSFPPYFCPERIVDFKLPNSLLTLENPFQVSFEDLTFINLSQCLDMSQIPDMSGAKNLRVLTIDRCHKLVGLDKSIGIMPNLVYLSASDCTMLKSFVPRMYLPSLQVLSLNFCRQLEHFPEVIQKMDKPLKIEMINTAIEEFRMSVSNLIGLQHMDLSISGRLKSLPSSLLLFPKLVTLKIDGCSQLSETFKRFKESHSSRNSISNLTTLYFNEANLSDEDLYLILESFPKLEDLKISHNSFISLPKCIKGSLHLKNLDVSYCRYLKQIPELPLSIQKVNARYCQSLTSETSSLLWSKVSKETENIQIVMPNMGIPIWFDYVCDENIPYFWARRKFPVVALAFVFGEVSENDEKQMDKFSELFDEMMPDKSHVVGLHLFIDGQEMCRKDYHYCSIGQDHTLLCDLRALFNDQEWQGLDACLGDDWKAIHIQCESNLILSHWGVYVYKQKTDINDIQFRLPNPNSSRKCISTSCLVPKTTPWQFEQKTRHDTERCSLKEIFGEYLPLTKSIDNGHIMNAVLRSWWNFKANIRGEPSPSDYGASRKHEHEDSVWDVVQYLDVFKENIPKNIATSYPEYIEIASHYVEKFLCSQVEYLRDIGHGRLDIRTYIVLEECHFDKASSRRCWGTFELKSGDPAFEAVMRKICQLQWRFWDNNQVYQRRLPIILLKCQHPSTDEALEEEYYDPALQALMSKIEEDAMRLNKTCGKLKAAIVLTDFPVSDNYIFETIYIRSMEKVGRMGFIFRKTPYGKLRVELVGWRFALRQSMLCCKLVFCVLILITLCLVVFFIRCVDRFVKYLLRKRGNNRYVKSKDV